MSIADVEKNTALEERFELGGFVTNRPAKLIQLVAGAASSGRYGTFRKQGETSGYTPPSGKRFICVAVEIVRNGGAANERLGVQGASNDVGLFVTTIPTDIDLGLPYPNTLYVTTVAYENLTLPFFYSLISGRYLFCYEGGTSVRTDFRVYGYELDDGAEEI